MKSAGVPVFWVGLPAQRGNRATSDSAYLNELYRGRAEKAGVTYVDVWDGFVDDSGRFVVQGPDFEGQIRRLRAGDGVYFTKAGARKLAHYVEREILRSMTNRAMPVALPAPEPAPVAPGARPPSGPAPRPLAGPVVPLTSLSGGDELLGGGPTRAAPSPQRPAPVDPAASRVLTKGEPLPAPTGRADDFGWPRGNPARPAAAATSPAAPTQATGSRPAAVSPPAAAAVSPPPVTAQPITAAAPPEPAAEPPVAEPKPAVKRKPPAPRPVVRRDVRPEPFSPFASSPGLWR